MKRSTMALLKSCDIAGQSREMAGRPGRFERSEDGQTWAIVDPQVMRRRLDGAYRDVDMVIRAMVDDGQPVRTPFASYRFVTD
jgi:predicted metalloprotease